MDLWKNPRVVPRDYAGDFLSASSWPLSFWDLILGTEPVTKGTSKRTARLLLSQTGGRCMVSFGEQLPSNREGSLFLVESCLEYASSFFPMYLFGEADWWRSVEPTGERTVAAHFR